MVPYQVSFLITFLVGVSSVTCIMVPSGKIGPITPAKPMAIYVNPSAYKVPAPVWENVDESGSPYKPPVYNYVLYDYVMKYGHHTLIPREEDYYNPSPPRMKTVKPYLITSKNNFHYSPLQFL